MVANVVRSTFFECLCGILFVTTAVVPAESQDYNWIRKIKPDFRVPNEPVLFDPKKVIMCSVELLSETFKGDGKYTLENSFDGTLCTHLVYNEYYVNNMFNITLDNKHEEFLRRTHNLASKYPHLKILMAISLEDGVRSRQSAAEFLKTLLSSKQNRFEFISNIKSLQKHYGIHGIYLDFSFFYNPAGLRQFKLLANEIRDAFADGEKFITAVQVDLSPRHHLQVYYAEITEISKIFDFVCARGYHFYWHTGERYLAVNGAPLYSSFADDENIYDSLQHLITIMRVDPAKVILEIPSIGRTYSLISTVNNSGLLEDTLGGYGFKGPFRFEDKLGYWGYNEICSDVLFNKDSKWTMYWDEKSMAPFIKDDTRWITFENPRSVTEKVKLVRQLGLGGTFSAFIDADDFHGRCANVAHPLLKSINSVVEGLNDSLICSMYQKEDEVDTNAIISCNFYVKFVGINDTVRITCTVEGYTDGIINWMKVASGGYAETITNITSELQKTRKNCSSYWHIVSKLEMFIDSKKRLGKYVIDASDGMSSANTSIFIALEDHPYVVSDDNIWIEEIDVEFPLFNNTSVISAYKLYETDPVVFCTMDLQNQKEKPNGIHDDNFKQIVNEFNGSLCTHIVFSDILIDDQFNITKDSQFEFRMSIAVERLQKKYSHLKFLLELSSKSSKYFSARRKTVVYSSDEALSVFLTAIKTYLKKFHLNGAILQISYYYQIGVSTSEIFFNELCDSFHEDGFLIAMEIEIHMSKKYLNRFKSNGATTNKFDFFSLKTYGVHPESNITEHNFPIHSEFSKNTIEGDLKHIIDYLGINSSKLILQIPFSGFSYTLKNPSSFPFGLNTLANSSSKYELGYNEICSSTLSNNSKDWKMYWDNKAKVPFLKRGNEWISFDNSRSIYEKMIIVAKSRLKGVMVRSVNQDDIFGDCSNIPFPLLETVHRAVKQTIIPRAQISESPSGYIIGAITAVFVIFLLISIAFIHGRKNHNGLSQLEVRNFREGYSDVSTEHEDIAHVSSQPYDKSYEIPPSRYTIDHTRVLGSGAFGIVLLGSIKDLCNEVAVKSVKPGASKEYIISLLSELKIMIHLGKHLNIVSLVGASTAKLHRGTAFIFVEYSPIGSLHQHLRNSRDNFVSSVNSDAMYNNVEPSQRKRKSGILATEDLQIYSYQIASGLQHLSIKKIIHGDLATRNILVFENNVVKISDFGLSRKLYDYNYVKKSAEPLPWRWMAIESLKDMTFSTQSDRWSFGVTLWEIFSLAETPYAGLQWTIDFVDMLKQNLRLSKPIHASSELYDFMVECWREAPEDRPTADNAVDWFHKVVQQGKKCDQDFQLIVEGKIDEVPREVSAKSISV